MFVKILWTGGNISLYECESVLLVESEKENGDLTFLMEPGGQHIDVDNEVNNGVYYLNNEGNTIDFIRGPIRK